MPDNFPELFAKKLESAGSEGFKLIQAFIADGKAEDLYLDFKRKTNPAVAALDRYDQIHLSKAMSGFANSAGGVIVWGVVAERSGNAAESPDIATDLQPIQNLDAFHSILNDSFQGATRPVVSDATNLKVQIPGSNTGYVVTYVPEVENPPYRAEWSGKYFYKRAGSRFYEMEPYDIRDVILRGKYPKIQIETSWTRLLASEDLHVYELAVLIVNLGPSVLDSWKFVVEYPKVLGARQEAAMHITTLDSLHDFVGPDGQTWERATVFSHPGFQSAYHQVIPLFPEDGLQLFGQTGRFRLPYKINNDLFRHWPWSMRWRFYGDGPPMQEGQIVIGPNSYSNY